MPGIKQKQAENPPKMPSLQTAKGLNAAMMVPVTACYLPPKKSSCKASRHTKPAASQHAAAAQAGEYPPV